MITIVVPTLDVAQGMEVGCCAATRAGVDCTFRVEFDMERTGYTRAANRALAQVTEGDACILVDDCEVEQGWLAALAQAVRNYRHLNVWFAGPSGPCRTWPQNTGGRGNMRRPRVVDHLAGFCLYVTRQALDAGLMDEAYTHYASEVDWQWRMAREHRARSLWVPSVYADHGLHAPHAQWWAHDQALLNERWHSTPGLE